ncbi:MAG: tetratricopeptide repeat protein [Armatimonadetes bacterium]|nr:tetratricopeptide repeat protein [Armatimonadota bacterium]
MGRFQHLELGRASEPIEEAKEGIHDDAYFINQARGKFDEGEYEAALTAYSRALRYDPNILEAWAGQLRALIELGELEEAILWADKGLERLKDAADLLAAKAMALARQGDVEKSLGFSDAAVEQKSPSSFVWLARADVLMCAQRSGAKPCLQKCVEQTPNDWRTLADAGTLCLYHSDSPHAAVYLERAVKLYDRCAYVWFLLGQAQYLEGNRERAVASLRRALVLRPRFSEAEQALRKIGSPGVLSRIASLFLRK